MRGTLEQRFWAKVDRRSSEECWPWTGSINRGGYGRVRSDGPGNLQAHRVAYELGIGPIPSGLQIDHLCRTRHCVNPAHLEAVTQKENLLRGVGASARNAVKDECKHGHPFDLFNTIFTGNGWRRCRACKHQWDQSYAAKRAGVSRALVPFVEQ